MWVVEKSPSQQMIESSQMTNVLDIVKTISILNEEIVDTKFNFNMLITFLQDIICLSTFILVDDY